MKLAITGGTGFVGRHLIRLATEAGHEVRALARRGQPDQPGVTWVAGALNRPDSLAALVAGVEAVIHVAGVINAPDRAGFAAGNIAGTQAMLTATTQAGVSRFVHVSSLAAREPALSDYGWSKAESEAPVAAASLDWTIVRPPAVYGPGDREMLELFRMAKRGVMPLPPGGRLSLIHVEDLARLLLLLATGDGALRETIEPDDGVPGGWDHRDLARAIGAAVDRRVLPLPVPAAMLRLVAWGDGLIRRDRAKLTPDRVRYFCHPDWVAARRPAAGLWRPAVATADGLRATAAWYRAAGRL
ncbi:NAD-dependent epimerase/dehydratase family protein [Sphingomonas solaris]|uniref:NAD-dependent epimerase/dehydratase family protein n=1 Tax=Alterirhizorhabdus solaris TaxID=2529389 RepID=A0A558RAB0_9SPHN|nr:NAD-dependent epimerase/dehydratase family protein [Sphingomonas solaris]TVV76298.1 NAD-dependent epimerase/dehydratase family protein [Sphingomonas solaris]